MWGLRFAFHCALAAALPPGVLSGPALQGGTARVAFGSCNMATLEQPLWAHVLARRPDVWIWGGDAVYADTPEVQLFPRPRVTFTPGDGASIRRIYAAQDQVPGYAELKASPAQIVGTWDDHDYGVNDGDRTFASRRESQAAFLDFIGEPAGSERRRQEGVYAARSFQFAGNRSILVVLLDMRFHRDPYGTEDGDFLGREQWLWLERLLAASTAQAHVIVSSLQFLELRRLGEYWGRFPRARERLLRLLTRVAAPIVISGDVHFAEFNAARCAGGQALVEVTSSGMTHSWQTGLPIRVVPCQHLVERAMTACMRAAQRLMPWWYQMRDERTGAPQFYLGLNFGELEFDWERESVTVSIVGVDGRVQLQRSFLLRQLSPQGGDAAAHCVPEQGDHPGYVPLLLAAAAGLPLALATAVAMACARRTRPKLE